jgi:phosphoenolpyruvate carboxylase
MKDSPFSSPQHPHQGALPPQHGEPPGAPGAKPRCRESAGDPPGLRLDPEPPLLLSSWYGAGSALAAYVRTEGGLNVLREMYERWPVFQTLVDFVQMTLAKSDLRIAGTYTSLVADPEIQNRLWKGISEEHASCVEALLKITGNENLLDASPGLQRSIRLHNPYVDPLSYIQVSLLRQLRGLPEDSSEREAVLNTLLLTISAISSGMLNTG